MTITNSQIREHYKEKYQSSPLPVTTYELRVLKKSDCECGYCRESIFELDDYPRIHKGEVVCERCYHEHFESTCPICEEYFDKALRAKDEKIVITKEAAQELGIDKPGFYQVKSYPYYRAAVVWGVEQLYQSSLELMRECDINSMLKRLGRGEITSGECCHECVDKYSGKSELKNNYVNRAYGKKQIALEKQVIKDGF